LVRRVEGSALNQFREASKNDPMGKKITFKQIQKNAIKVASKQFDKRYGDLAEDEKKIIKQLQRSGKIKDSNDVEKVLLRLRAMKTNTNKAMEEDAKRGAENLAKQKAA